MQYTIGIPNIPVTTPVFIPLKTEYYEAFCDGSKTVEYRQYGPRWNERTCQVGRRVTISKGYGKQTDWRGVASLAGGLGVFSFSKGTQ